MNETFESLKARTNVKGVFKGAGTKIKDFGDIIKPREAPREPNTDRSVEVSEQGDQSTSLEISGPDTLNASTETRTSPEEDDSNSNKADVFAGAPARGRKIRFASSIANSITSSMRNTKPSNQAMFLEMVQHTVTEVVMYVAVQMPVLAGALSTISLFLLTGNYDVLRLIPFLVIVRIFVFVLKILGVSAEKIGLDKIGRKLRWLQDRLAVEQQRFMNSRPHRTKHVIMAGAAGAYTTYGATNYAGETVRRRDKLQRHK